MGMMTAKLFKKIWFKIVSWILIITFTGTTSIILYNHIIKKDIEENSYKTKTDYKVSNGDGFDPKSYWDEIETMKKKRKNENYNIKESINKYLNTENKKQELSTELKKYGCNLTLEYIPDQYATDRVLKNITIFVEKQKEEQRRYFEENKDK